MSTQQAPIKALRNYHQNPRKGDIKVVAESLQELGQYRPIVVNVGTHTGRPNEILAGNHTYLAAKSLGWNYVMATYVDVDDDRAAAIVLADNRTSDLGTYDNSELASLLEELPDLAGTGYSEDDMQDLLIEAEIDLQLDDSQGGQQGDQTPLPDPFADEEAGGDRWATAARKTIILGYPLDQFVWVTDQFQAIGKTFGTNSNADTLKRLLEGAK